MGCLTHEDWNCDIWIKSEGNLSIENQQYGPWIKVAPFVPSKSKVVTVLAYYAMKKKANPPSNPIQGSKPPVVVFRSEKPSPKVIRPKKEGIFLNQFDPMDLNFQHTKKAHSNLNQIDLNGEGNVSLNVADLEEKIRARKNFKETLEILDKEIAMFKVVTTTTVETSNPLSLFNIGPITLYHYLIQKAHLPT